jgi:hypothetical protein
MQFAKWSDQEIGGRRLGMLWDDTYDTNITNKHDAMPNAVDLIIK